MWRWLMFALPLFVPDDSALKHGEDWTLGAHAASRPRVEPRFEGPTSVLIGERTFSSAMLLADAARTYDLMLTVGQPTGGVPNALGDIGPVRPHIEVAPVAGRDAMLERAVIESRRMAAERK